MSPWLHSHVFRPFLSPDPLAHHKSADCHLQQVRDPVYHAKLRRVFTPSFSKTSLRAYEPVIHKYTDMFIDQIGKLGSPSSEGINITGAFNWVTFDIIGTIFPSYFLALFNIPRGHQDTMLEMLNSL